MIQCISGMSEAINVFILPEGKEDVDYCDCKNKFNFVSLLAGCSKDIDTFHFI